MSATPVLAASDLAFAWGKRGVLDGFSLAVPAGQHVAFLGPNGSGKSTLLRLFAGLARPSRGTIAWSFGADFRKHLGVVFQQPALDLSLSARENLGLAATIHGLDRASGRRQADRLLAFVALAERAQEPAKNLSGGMRRRLDLARALVSEPDVLLLDEPTAGLDAEHAERFWNRIAAWRADRAGTLLTATHRAEEAELADRLVMLHAGRIVHDGAPRDVLASLGKDLLVVTAAQPAAADATASIAGQVMARLGAVARVVVTAGRAEVVIEVPPGDDATRLLVKVVELCGPGRIDTIALRRPTLADAFAKLTAAALDEPARPVAEAA